VQEVDIIALGRQGDGIAEGPVFVPGGLPGERVTGEVVGDRLTEMRIVRPSSERVKPPCQHFRTCGGCQMQHASDALVAEWKLGIVAEALEKQGLRTDIRGIETSPLRSRRRARFSGRRTKAGALGGFHARISDTVVDVVDCPLIAPTLAQGPELSRALAVAGASRKGEVGVQCTATTSGLDVAVEGGKPLDRALRVELPQIAARFGVARLVWEGELVAQEAPPRHRIGRAQVSVPPGAFLQATAHGESVLQDCVLEATEGAARMADLFAGCGTFALRLAERGPVMAVESVCAMTDSLQEAANHAALPYPVEAVTRDLYREPLVPEELERFEAVVLDPPRAGAAAQVAELARSTVPVLAYVSCDPSSFARDAATLVAGGYRLDWVQVVDQFRWSPHTELAARLSRPHKRGT
jgi:23S rRNA (uracil1939-C5)-methyltransferase